MTLGHILSVTQTSEVEVWLIITRINEKNIFSFLFFNDLQWVVSGEIVILVWFYGISTMAGYLMPNPLHTYILNIYDLVWFGFMSWQPL